MKKIISILMSLCIVGQMDAFVKNVLCIRSGLVFPTRAIASNSKLNFNGIRKIRNQIEKTEIFQFSQYLLKRPSLKKSGKLTASKIEEGIGYSVDEINKIVLEKRYQKVLKAFKNTVRYTGLASVFMYGMYKLPVDEASADISIMFS